MQYGVKDLLDEHREAMRYHRVTSYRARRDMPGTVSAETPYLLRGMSTITRVLGVDERVLRRWSIYYGFPLLRIGHDYVTSWGAIDAWILAGALELQQRWGYVYHAFDARQRARMRERANTPEAPASGSEAEKQDEHEPVEAD